MHVLYINSIIQLHSITLILAFYSLILKELCTCVCSGGCDEGCYSLWRMRW